MELQVRRWLSAVSAVTIICTVAAIVAQAQTPGKQSKVNPDKKPPSSGAPSPPNEKQPKKKGFSERADAPPLTVGNLSCVFSDGSKVNLSLVAQNIQLHTAFGELTIPVKQIRGIRFATRTRPEVLHQVKRSIRQLGSDQFRTRQDATIRLRAWGAVAYPILKQSENVKDAEVKKRIRSLINEIAATKSAADLKFRSQDEIQTDNSTFSGQIKADTLAVDTFAFGRRHLQLTDIRSMSHRRLAQKALPLLPDPGNLSRFQNQLGKSFRFHVTGNVRGAIWGSKMYTLDSRLGTAAVHAGVVKAGQKGIVTVRILKGQRAFKGSFKNGVRSSSYGPYPGAYEIIKSK